MNPLIMMWWSMMQNAVARGPLSRDVFQDIIQTINLFSPQFDINVGDPKIEADVVTRAASYGKQLGILMEALLELAEGRPSEGQERDPIARLRRLQEQIEDVKQSRSRDLEATARDALSQLSVVSPAAVQRLAREFQAEQ